MFVNEFDVFDYIVVGVGVVDYCGIEWGGEGLVCFFLKGEVMVLCGYCYLIGGVVDDWDVDVVVFKYYFVG